MTYFLERIATLLWDQYPDRLEKQCLVFPNRRAGLYFLKYLAGRIDRPVWTPEIVTINELFGSYSTLNTVDNEILLFELYKVYRKLREKTESFDDFYFWGDMLINDFDDVDKYMVDASELFRNIKNIREIDNEFGGLTPEQAEIVKRFWIDFNYDNPTREKDGFLGIWSILYSLYTGFRKSLIKQNIAYEGMIFREVAEKSNLSGKLDIKWDNVHFIGFNALNTCEKELMLFYKKVGKGKFYWDFDNSYLTGSKLSAAGFFLKQNLDLFGNDMPEDWNYDTYLSGDTAGIKRTVIDTSSDVAQVKLISGLIDDIPGLSAENAHHTAVVLADENLLLPVLSSLPAMQVDINITMGYPLKQAPVYTFVSNLLNLQKNVRIENGIVRFYHEDVTNILKSRFISHLTEEKAKETIDKIITGNLIWVESESISGNDFMHTVFQKTEAPATLSAYLKNILTEISVKNVNTEMQSDDYLIRLTIRNEFIYRIILSINRLETVVSNKDIVFSKETYIRILDKILRGQSVPFSGEPLSGIQIMGILETRALDFTNLIIVSVNDGVIPGSSSVSSFIPFSIREAFRLPTINHKESVYAYHFYRLLQRAENVTFIYNSNSEGLKTGEMSRFLTRMKYDPLLKPEFRSLRFEIQSQNALNQIIERSSENVEQLRNQFFAGKKSSVLSPTAINTWLNCSMRFYYRYVCRLKEPEKISVEVDPGIFGTLLHYAMKKIYIDLKGKESDKNVFHSLLKQNKKLEETIDAVISEVFTRATDVNLSGNELIVKEILKSYINQIILLDSSLAPIKILHLEESFKFDINFRLGEEEFFISTGGIVDRIDEIGGTIRIVDYKTGTVAAKIGSVQEMFDEKRKKDNDGWLQTLLYCEAYLVADKSVKIRPSIYKVRELSGDKLSDNLRLKGSNNQDIIIDDYNQIREEFINSLKETVEEMFSENKPFIMTTDLSKCEYCPYRSLCMR